MKKVTILAIFATLSFAKAQNIEWKLLNDPNQRIAYLYHIDKKSSTTIYEVIFWYKTSVPGDNLIKHVYFYRDGDINSFTCNNYVFTGKSTSSLSVNMESYSLNRRKDSFLSTILDSRIEEDSEKIENIIGECSKTLEDKLFSGELPKVSNEKLVQISLSDPAERWIPSDLWNKAYVNYTYDANFNELTVDVKDVK